MTFKRKKEPAIAHLMFKKEKPIAFEDAVPAQQQETPKADVCRTTMCKVYAEKALMF